MEFGEMKRNTSNWSIFACFRVARVWQRQLGSLVSTHQSNRTVQPLHNYMDLKQRRKRDEA